MSLSFPIVEHPCCHQRSVLCCDQRSVLCCEQRSVLCCHQKSVLLRAEEHAVLGAGREADYTVEKSSLGGENKARKSRDTAAQEPVSTTASVPFCICM